MESEKAPSVRLPAVLFIAFLIALISAAILLIPFWAHDSSNASSAPIPEDLAAIEFQRVKAGLRPACQGEPDYGLSDGGTLFYDCGRYQLTVKKSLATQSGVDGYLYGPIVTFESGKSMSDVRFYTNQELSHLLASKDGL